MKKYSESEETKKKEFSEAKTHHFFYNGNRQKLALTLAEHEVKALPIKNLNYYNNYKVKKTVKDTTIEKNFLMNNEYSLIKCQNDRSI